MRVISQIIIMCMALTLPAHGMKYPTAGDKDYAMRDAVYDPDQIFFLSTAVGYSTIVLLQEGEEIEKWPSGDAGAWEIEHHKNMVSIKPKVVQSTSNIFFYTNKGRVYAFKITIKDKDPYYGVRFHYPDDEKRKAEKLAEEESIKKALKKSVDPSEQDRQETTYKNYAYIAAGDTEIRPIRVFDNGLHTFFTFSEGQDLPAIFRSTPNGEKMTQKSVKDNVIIIPHVEHEWMLRLGNLVTCVRNDSFTYEKINKTSTASDGVILKVKDVQEVNHE